MTNSFSILYSNYVDENPVQSLGFISRLKNRLSQVNQRTAFDAFIVLLILIGLAASVYLAGQRQIFRSRAAQEGNAVVVDQNGKEIELKEGDATVVETPQIRLKIEFPTDWNTQGFVPSSLFSPAYAAEAPQCLNQNETRCQGTTCINANYYEGSNFVRDGYEAGCYQCSPSCSSGTAPQPTQAPAPTAVPTQPPAQTATCIGSGYKCASPINQTSALAEDGSTCTSYLGNSSYNTSCVARGTGYDWCYTSCAQPTAVPTRPPAAAQPTATSAPVQACGGRWEGNRTECSADANRNAAGCTYLDAWSRPRSNVCGESTPFCWACPESAFGPPAQPTAPPPRTTTAPAVGAPQPPTATPVPEQTLYIQVSLKQEKLGKDKCTSSSDPADHCFQFSTADLVARGSLVDWWLPNQRGLHTIYIGFISDKGRYRDGPQVKVNYQPKQAAPTRAAGSPTSVLDSLAGATNVSCINARAFQYSSGTTESIDTGYFCRCRGNVSGDAVAMIVDPETGKDLTETNSPCQGEIGPLPTLPQPTAQPTPKPSVTCDQLYEECMNTVEATKETCDRMKANCKSLPFVPTPTPTTTIKRCDEVRGVCAKSDTGESFTEILFCSGLSMQGNYSCPIGYKCFEQNSCIKKEDAKTPTPTPIPPGFGTIKGTLNITANQRPYVFMIMLCELFKADRPSWSSCRSLIDTSDFVDSDRGVPYSENDLSQNQYFLIASVFDFAPPHNLITPFGMVECPQGKYATSCFQNAYDKGQKIGEIVKNGSTEVNLNISLPPLKQDTLYILLNKKARPVTLTSIIADFNTLFITPRLILPSSAKLVPGSYQLFKNPCTGIQNFLHASYSYLIKYVGIDGQEKITRAGGVCGESGTAVIIE